MEGEAILHMLYTHPPNKAAVVVGDPQPPLQPRLQAYPATQKAPIICEVWFCAPRALDWVHSALVYLVDLS